VRNVHPDRVERTVAAAPDAVFAVVEDAERYPEWLPAIEAVEVKERDAEGRAVLVRVSVRISLPVLSRDLAFTGRVIREPPQQVTLRREAGRSGDEQSVTVTWTVAPEGTGTRVGLELEAAVDAPRLVPLGPVGDMLAKSFADALVRRVDA
jgi:ribosome-associated toxin RatA of RatAB toxin-antitoxin module